MGWSAVWSEMGDKMMNRHGASHTAAPAQIRIFKQQQQKRQQLQQRWHTQTHTPQHHI